MDVHKHLRNSHQLNKCQVCDENFALYDTTHDCLGERARLCEYCDRAFDSMHMLMEHLCNDHTEAEQLTFVCEICKRKFRMRMLLEAHRDRHSSGDFACTKCPKVFDTSHELKSHKRAVHIEASKAHISCNS